MRKTEGVLHVEENGKIMVTTKEVLKEERRMVELAREGNGKVIPLYTMPPLLSMEYSDDQKNAITHVVTTANRVSIIRGGAGTGKTKLLEETVELIKRTGKAVTMTAPTGQTARTTLRDEGFKDAETVARLLVDKDMLKAIKDNVLIVDEAGLLGTKDMLDLLQLVKQENARLILIGDTRQHSSVVRGDALRILNTVAGIKVAEMTKIFRQKNYQYKDAVENLSKGDIKAGFEKLDDMGAIKTIDPLNPNRQLVDDYLNAIKKGKKALVIAPTHKQGDDVTDDIRAKLRKENRLGKKEVSVTRYINLNFTEAEKADIRNYEPGQVLQFNQNLKPMKTKSQKFHIERGSKWTIKSIEDQQLKIVNDKKQETTIHHRIGHFEVFEQSEIKLSKGDKVRITKGGFDTDKRRLNNGMMFDVVSVSKLGKIELHNKTSRVKASIYKNFGHLAHAHCITSHASQGKTVDEVFISQPSGTFDATNAKQFYVSVSRGRDAAHIYTDDKETLLEHAAEIGDRQSALELVNKKSDHILQVVNKQRQDYNLPVQKRQKEYSQNKTTIDRGYEPGI